MREIPKSWRRHFQLSPVYFNLFVHVTLSNWGKLSRWEPPNLYPGLDPGCVNPLNLRALSQGWLSKGDKDFPGSSDTYSSPLTTYRECFRAICFSNSEIITECLWCAQHYAVVLTTASLLALFSRKCDSSICIHFASTSLPPYGF